MLFEIVFCLQAIHFANVLITEKNSLCYDPAVVNLRFRTFVTEDRPYFTLQK